jgi:hypothetical protein
MGLISITRSGRHWSVMVEKWNLAFVNFPPMKDHGIIYPMKSSLLAVKRAATSIA